MRWTFACRGFLWFIGRTYADYLMVLLGGPDGDNLFAFMVDSRSPNSEQISHELEENMYESNVSDNKLKA